MDCRSLPEAPDSECTHISILTLALRDLNVGALSALECTRGVRISVGGPSCVGEAAR